MDIQLVTTLVIGKSEEEAINILKPYKLHFMVLTYEQKIPIKCLLKNTHTYII
jgi:hypothetical protein